MGRGRRRGGAALLGPPRLRPLLGLMIFGGDCSSIITGTVLGDHSFWKEWPPRPPKKAPGGESFDSLSPWTPSLNDQRRGPAGPLPLETSPSCSADRKFTPTAYFVTPRGFIRFSVNVPCSCPRPAKNMVRSAPGGGDFGEGVIGYKPCQRQRRKREYGSL